MHLSCRIIIRIKQVNVFKVQSTVSDTKSTYQHASFPPLSLVPDFLFCINSFSLLLCLFLLNWLHIVKKVKYLFTNLFVMSSSGFIIKAKSKTNKKPSHKQQNKPTSISFENLTSVISSSITIRYLETVTNLMS